MKNLKLLTHTLLEAISDVSSAHCMCVDCDTGTIYCATASQLVSFEPSTGQVITGHNLLSSEKSDYVIEKSYCINFNT